MITPHSAHPGVVIPAGFYPGDVPSWSGFDTEIEAPSVANLSRSLTINGTTVAPTFCYNGIDATATAWPAWDYGKSLAIAGSGDAPSVNQGSPLMGSLDDSVKFNAAKYYTDTDNSQLDLGTDDFVIEVVAKVGAANLDVFSSYVNGPNYTSLESSGATLRFLWIKASYALLNISGSALGSGAWGHFIFFIDRSGSGICYANSVAGSAVSLAAYSGVNFTQTANFCIGASTGGGGAYDSNIAYCAMWQRANWLDTHLQATLAAQRFRALTGSRPQTSTAGRDTAPITLARNCSATLQKYNTSTSAVEYYTVGPNWPRVERWWDATRSTTVMGIRSELQAINLCKYSGDLSVDGSGNPWLHTRASATASIISEDDSNNTHYVFQGSIPGTDGVTYCVAFDAKAINRTEVQGNINVAGYTANFNLTTGVAGAKGASVVSSGMIPLGDSKYRCWYTFVKSGTGNFACVVNPMSGGATSYQGVLGQQAISCERVQVEAASYPSSYIATTTGAVTRVKDEIEFSVTHPGAQGAFAFDVITEAADLPSVMCLLDLSSGGNNRAFGYCIGAGDYYQVGAQTDGLATSSTRITDGATRRVGGRWTPGGLECWISGALVATDTSYTALTTMNQLAVGMAYNNTIQPGIPTLIRNVRVYDRFPADMARLTVLS